MFLETIEAVIGSHIYHLICWGNCLMSPWGNWDVSQKGDPKKSVLQICDLYKLENNKFTMSSEVLAPS